jgi:chemotaxis protein methyltransferase CheR
MDPQDFEFLCGYLQERSGLQLTPGKEYLVTGRLQPVAQRRGCRDLADLVARLRQRPPADLVQEVVEAMTTNETLFFRDKTPFEDLRGTLLPELIEQRRHERRLRLWCAACSTGQEPYSLLMMLDEHFPELAHWQVEVVATDLDSTVLARARTGLYSHLEIQRGLPIQLLIKYFQQAENGWQIRDSLRQRVQWRQLNLLQPFDALGRFDVICCRNVLIYFDEPTKRDVLTRLTDRLSPSGALLLGAAETAIGLSSRLMRDRRCKSTIYGHVARVPVHTPL